MKFIYLSLSLFLISGATLAQDSPYGSCPERAEAYQKRFESTGQSKDFVCFEKALQREFEDVNNYHCPRSAQHYQTAYEQNGNVSDMVCFQQALEREL